MAEFCRGANAMKQAKKKQERKEGGRHKEIGRRRPKWQVQVSGPLNAACFGNEHVNLWDQTSHVRP
jgi:hypothetical protein